MGTPSFFSQELLGPSWCRVIFKEPSSYCWWLTLVWMTPVPSITRPWCHRWRNNNRLNYPALHTWLNSAHCSPTNLEDGSFCAGSPDGSTRWAQVVARACPLLLHQRYSSKRLSVGGGGRKECSTPGLEPQPLRKAVINQEMKLGVSPSLPELFILASRKWPAHSQVNI